MEYLHSFQFFNTASLYTTVSKYWSDMGKTENNLQKNYISQLYPVQY